MKIILQQEELLEAVKLYLESVGLSAKSVEVSDDSVLSVDITLGSVPKKEVSEEDKPEPVKRTRKKKEVIEEDFDDEPDILPANLYEGLPKLVPEETEQYIKLLSLLSTNALNKNKEEIAKTYQEATPNARTVMEANAIFKDWLKQNLTDKTSEPVVEKVEETASLEIETSGSSVLDDIIEDVVKPEPVNKPLFGYVPNVQKSGALFPVSR